MANTFNISTTVIRTWRVLSNHAWFLLLAAIGSIWIRLARLAWPFLLGHLVLNLPLHLLHFITSSPDQASFFLYWTRELSVISSLEGFASAVICYAAFCAVQGMQPTLKDCFSAVARRLIPLFVLSLITNIAWEIGFHFFVVPGLLVATAVTLAMPVCLIEKAGPLRSLVRSFTLVRRHFWPILAVVGFWLLFLQTLYRVLHSTIHNWRLSMFAAWPVVTVAISITTTFSAVLYYDLSETRKDLRGL